jgi:hypothetical protein
VRPESMFTVFAVAARRGRFDSDGPGPGSSNGKEDWPHRKQITGPPFLSRKRYGSRSSGRPWRLATLSGERFKTGWTDAHSRRPCLILDESMYAPRVSEPTVLMRVEHGLGGV